MTVVTTNLAIRFYKHHGWTEEKVLSLLYSCGECSYFDDQKPYWIPEVGTHLNLDKLMEMTTFVERTFNDYPLETDREHLARFLW